jgi:transcriptional regulator with XRE-family HTH domain
MLLSVGEVIAEQRKKKNVTQQDLADFIGVTKASVSKWETNQTYPDITLLPLLAAYFDISIDSLLSYNSQLTSEEIQNIYRSLQGTLKTCPEDTLESLNRFIRRYYSCYPFILQMGLFIINHFDLLPGENRESNFAVYIPKAQQLFQHIVSNTTDAKLLDEAHKFQAYTLFMLGEYDKVLELLGEYTPVNFPIEPLIAGALQRKGQNKQAIGVMQSGIFQNVAVTMSFLTNYLQMLLDQPQQFIETVEKGKKLAQVFHFGQLNPIPYVNFLTSAAYGLAMFNNEEQLTPILEEYVTVLQNTKFPVVIHGDNYFDHIDEWIKQLDLGNQLPRETGQIKKDFIDLLLHNPVFDPYKQKDNMKPFFKELEFMGKEEEHE